jgi:2-polyprenyl-3-methyl-5-hydroxy-6-metoxy-1,4-benzoquinol methylase
MQEPGAIEKNRSPMLSAALATARAQAVETLFRLPPRSAQRMLHCPCGDGRLGRRWMDEGVGQVVGIDGHAESVEEARARLPEVLHGAIEDMTLPFERESFDCILLDGILPRLRDPRRFVERMAPLLSPSGLLIASSPNLQFFSSVQMLAEGRIEYGIDGVWSRDHIRFYTGHELLRLFWDAGLPVARLIGLAILPPEVLPLDSAQRLALGKISLGPLDETEYLAFRTEQYAVLGAAIDELSVRL